MTKKYLFALLPIVLLLTANRAVAQDFNVFFISDRIESDEEFPHLYLEGSINNLTDEAITLRIVRTVEELPEDWGSSICTDICFPPNVDTIHVEIPAQARQTVAVTYYSDGVSGEGYVDLEFSTDNTPGISKRLFVRHDLVSSVWEGGRLYGESPMVWISGANSIRVSEHASNLLGKQLELTVFDALGNKLLSAPNVVPGQMETGFTFSRQPHPYRITADGVLIEAGLLPSTE